MAVLVPVLTALIVRVLFLVTNWGSPFFRAPLVDAREFHDKAWLIASGAGLPVRPFDRPPFYTYFVAAVYRILGPEMRAVFILQCALGVATVALTVLVARRFFGRTVALASGLILALSRAPLVLEGELLNESVDTFLLIATAYVLVMAIARRRPFLLVAGALGGALAILTRPTSALFVVPALVVVATRRVGEGPASLGSPRGGALLFGPRALMLAGGLFLAVSASAAVRNWVVAGEWVPVSYNGGINFFIGNAARHEELVNIRPGLRWERLVQSPRALEESGVFRKSPWDDGFAAWDRRYYAAAFEDMVDDPVAALGRLAGKALQFWAAREIDRNVHPSAFVPAGSVLGRTTLSFALIGPPALAGLALLALRRPRGWALVVGFAAAVWASGIIFFVTSRYRVPAYPALAITSAYGLVALVNALRGPGRRREVALPGALLAAAVLIGIGDPGGAARIAPARALFLEGLALERSGSVAAALEKYRQAVSAYPDDPDVLMNPAAILIGTGRPEEGVVLAERAVKLVPDHPMPLFNLGLGYSALARHADAARAFARMTEVDPRDPRGFYQLGRSLIDAGDPESALAPLSRSAILAPDVPLPLVERARALLRLRRALEARSALENALRLDPAALEATSGYPELRALLPPR